MVARTLDELADQTRLADAGVADEGDDLARSVVRAALSLAKAVELRRTADEAREPAHRGSLEAIAGWAGAGELVDVDGLGQALDGHGAVRRRRHVALCEAQRLRREQRRARTGELLHARREVRGLADRGVVHVQVAADRAHHDLAGVEAHPDLHAARRGRRTFGRDPPDAIVHAERRVGGAHRVVLVGKRRAEDGHDAVAEHLVDRALVAMDRLHHRLDHGVEELARLLGIAVGQELEGALHVGEEHGDLLALVRERAARGADPFGEVARRIDVRRGEARRGR